jgi:hypothetical protein
MELKDLHDKLIAEGCNRFYIDGIGGLQSDDVECLGFNNGAWEVYYIERGVKNEPLFISENKQEAIKYYYKHITNQEHIHIVVFTRFRKLFNLKKEKLEQAGIKIFENNIPHYKEKDDIIYRLFVINKDIFKAKLLFKDVPYFDEDLKR